MASEPSPLPTSRDGEIRKRSPSGSIIYLPPDAVGSDRVDGGTGVDEGDESTAEDWGHPSVPLVMDKNHAGSPLQAFNQQAHDSAYGGADVSPVSNIPLLSPTLSNSENSSTSPYNFAQVQNAVQELSETYLFPRLSPNERERLTQLWLLQHGLEQDPAFQQHLTHLVSMVKAAIGYEVAILGLMDSDVYVRIATDGCPLAVLPRREATCAHTMLQPHKTVFNLPDLESDPRFANSPHVTQGGLRSYAGTQLCYVIPESQRVVVLGSLCVASFSKAPRLTDAQEQTLVRSAEVIMHSLTSQARLHRQTAQKQRRELLDAFSRKSHSPTSIIPESIELIKTFFPGCRVGYEPKIGGRIALPGEASIYPSKLEGCIWENTELFTHFIQEYNHDSRRRVYTGRTARAIILDSRHERDHCLTVSTSDIKFVFDETDLIFVQAVDLTIAGYYQDHQLRAALDSKASFLREVQHSLRTSLNGILSASEMLSDGTEAQTIAGDRSSATEAGIQPDSLLETIDTSGHNLLTVINSLLEYDNFTENIKVEPKLHDLYDIEEGTLESIVSASSRSKLAKITLISDNAVKDHIDTLSVDAVLLKQIAIAMLQNAFDATTEGLVTQKMWYDDYTNSLYIETSDSGCGLDECDKERIFAPFQKVDPFRQNAGLGLAFARKNATLLGGSVELVKSAVGIGSTFRFTLPKPVLACSWHSARMQIIEKLPQYTYWAADLEISTSFYATDLQRLSCYKSRDQQSADFVVITLGWVAHNEADIAKTLGPRQVAIALTYLTKGGQRADTGASAQNIVYCQMPICRNRLVAAMDQASRLLENQTQSVPIARTASRYRRATQAGRLDLDQLHFLLVDDNETNLNILKAYCKRRKYNQVAKYDGNEAYDAYVEGHTSGKPLTFVVMDLQMPNCDGIEATTRIRKYEREHGIPASRIYMVTGQSSDADRSRALKAGCDAYFVKPLRIKALDDLVAEHFHV